MPALHQVTLKTVDEELVARCRAGRLDAFNELYARYEAQVYRYAYHMLGHREDADDVKQETFVRAYQRMDSFRGDASVLTWLLRICGNLCRDRIKSWERRKVSYHPDAGVQEIGGNSHSADPLVELETKATNDVIFAALRAMPAGHREVLVLHEVQGHGYDVIGSVLNCSPASAKLRVFRARRVLRERVAAMLRVR